MTPPAKRLKIAIIGTGISGNAASWALNGDHDITVYEKNPRIGGHSHTVSVDYDGTEIAVDTGFIVYNERNYPNMTALFNLLGVPTEASNMSFAVSLEGGRLEYGIDTLNALLAQRSNIVSPRFWSMIREIFRFNKVAIADREAGLLEDASLGQFLDRRRFSEFFRVNYLLPMGGAIWSTPLDDVLDYPARSFVDFFDNHALVHPGQVPQWRTVSGGSREYVSRLTAPFADKIRLSTPVVGVRRKQFGVSVHDAHGHEEDFDHVIFACHSDEALEILGQSATGQERSALSQIRYRDNLVYLHRDESVMPKRRATWSSWNYLGWPASDSGLGGEMAVSYWMNRLQNIDNAHPLFVTLNPPRPPAEGKTFGVYSYAHPQFDGAALAARRTLDELQGRAYTWFCGAYHGYGFHEDGLVSGLKVAEKLGSRVPWRTDAHRRAAEATI